MMDTYVDSLKERMDAANSCNELTAAANEAFDSLRQAISDAQEEIERLEALITPPTDLPGVIKWIKAQIDTYLKPYETYMQQVAEYMSKLSEIQALLVKKAHELACSDTPEGEA